MSRFAPALRFVALVIALIWCVACNPGRSLGTGGDGGTGGDVMMSGAGGGDTTIQTTPFTYSPAFDFDQH